MYTRLELLKSCLSLQAESGKEKEQINPDIHLLLEDLKAVYNFDLVVEQQENGNIYITKGEAELYPCLVGHSDQVAKYNKDKVVVELGDMLLALDSSDGTRVDTGGDDLCAIWSIMQGLVDLPALKAVIFISEENGCHGSRAANMEFFNNCKFVIQFDRNHVKSDVINFTNGTAVCSKEFEEFLKPYIDKYEYSFTTGSVTDVGQLRKNGLKIASSNWSAGYFKPHTSNSYVIPSKLFTSYDMFLDIAKESTKQFVFEIEPPKVYTSFAQNNSKFVKSTASKLVALYTKETKDQEKHYTNNIIEWVVDILDKMDDANLTLPDYNPVVDTLWDYLITKDDSFYKKKVRSNLEKEFKKLSACNPKTCSESRQVDWVAIGGPEEVCTKCSRVFPIDGFEKFKPYTYGFDD